MLKELVEPQRQNIGMKVTAVIARLSIVTATVGGGFAGFATTLQALGESTDGGSTRVILIMLSGLYLYVLVAGLLFVQWTRLILPVAMAFGVQIPYLSSSLVAYQFYAGFHVTVYVVGTDVNIMYAIGSAATCWVGTKATVGFGINLFALVLFLSLIILFLTRTNARGSSVSV